MPFLPDIWRRQNFSLLGKRSHGAHLNSGGHPGPISISVFYGHAEIQRVWPNVQKTSCFYSLAIFEAIKAGDLNPN